MAGDCIVRDLTPDRGGIDGLARALSNQNDDPARLYVGQVMHARLRPFVHRFRYDVFNLMVDIDRLDEAQAQTRLLGINRAGISSFHEKDHGDGRARGLKDYIRKELRGAGIDEPINRIDILCYPRILGYVFNPISLYYCWGENGLAAMVYEVRNTFGGLHTYVEPVHPDQWDDEGLAQECDKVFHVSPFMGMSMRYFFRVTEPAEKVAFRILEKDQDGPLLLATLTAKKRALTSGSLARLLITIPFLTLKVMAGIHFEALKLWLKGAKFHANPHKGHGKRT